MSHSASNQLLISRNKHLPYIASYHGPWLSLPVDLLQSLLLLNAETALPPRTNDLSVPTAQINGDAPGAAAAVVKQKDSGANKVPTSPAAPPLDPVIFRSLVAIRKLVDDASELVIKAAGGGASSNPLGIPSSGGAVGNSGGVAGSRISGLRQHRFRELAVQKLARAYRIDEVATSVLTMQGASALDDVASKVLKRTPDNLDALYVHFFHEKIPSRMLAASTTTETLDRIINQRPGVAEYHRTRAMVYGFREEFQASLKDFKAAIMIAKKRKRFLSGPECERDPHHRHHKHYGNDAGAPKWEDLDECSEAQLYFLRGACYHQYAISILDRAIQAVNCDNAAKTKEAAKGTDLVVGHRPSKSANRGVQAYVSPDVMQAPLEAYKDAIAASSAQIASLVRKSIRDYEKFLDFFPNPTYAEGGPILSSPTRSSNIAGVDLDEAAEEQGELPSPTTSAAEMEEFLKSANLSTLLFGSALKEQANGNVKEPNFTSSSLASFRNALKDSDIQNAAKNLLSLGTYHPLLVEAWYAIGINLMLLNDWSGASAWHARIIKLQDSVDGYPVFLPARSMSQADYVEVITRMKKALLGTGRLIGDTKNPSAVKKITTGIKGVDFDEQETGDSLASLAVSKSAESPASKSKGSAGAGAVPEKGNLRQYPLHTKRADNVVMFLQYSPSN